MKGNVYNISRQALLDFQYLLEEEQLVEMAGVLVKCLWNIVDRGWW